MLTERLRAVIDSVAQLPPDAQDKVAAQIESAVQNAMWDAQLRDPRDVQVLRALAAEARREPKLPFPTREELEGEAQANTEPAE